MKLDPNKKYLIQDETNRIYIYSDALAGRRDMRPYDPETGEKKFPDTVNPMVAIELQGKVFQVAPDLQILITEMGEKLRETMELNERLQADAQNFDAFKERLTTDNLDLQEQLDEKNRLLGEALEQLAELAKTADPIEVPSAEPPKKGKTKKDE